MGSQPQDALHLFLGVLGVILVVPGGFGGWGVSGGLLLLPLLLLLILSLSLGYGSDLRQPMSRFVDDRAETSVP